MAKDYEDLVGRDFQFEGIYTFKTNTTPDIQLEETFKLEGYTPAAVQVLTYDALEETFNLRAIYNI